MEYKIIFRPLTEMTNGWTKKLNPHVNSAEEVQEVVINAQNEPHAISIFMNMIQHSNIKIANYRVEPLYEKNE